VMHHFPVGTLRRMDYFFVKMTTVKNMESLANSVVRYILVFNND
jgi:hypothetical protein